MNTVGLWGPALLIVLMYALAKIWPKSDSYFRKAYLTLNEVDDITDAILEEFPKLSYIQTVDDLVEEVLGILEKRYSLEEGQKEQVKERIKADINRKEGWNVDWQDGVGKIEFNKKF